jgi:hypothetical protein
MISTERNEVQKAIDKVMTKMFSYVGETHSPEYTAEHNWFLKKIWTEEQEKDFHAWFEKEMRNDWVNLKCLMNNPSKRNIPQFVSMFIFNYGWKCSNIFGGKNEDSKVD